MKGITLSEIIQKKTNAIWPHLHVEPKKQNKQKEQNKTETDYTYRKQTGGCQRGDRWGWMWNRWGGLRHTKFQIY